MATTVTFDLPALARAIETRDADGVARHYADDAELVIVDRDHPPASPTVHRGIDAIRAYYADVCGRNMEHEVTDDVASGERVAYTQRCRYPDGSRVLCATVAELQGGRIIRQTAVQAWDD